MTGSDSPPRRIDSHAFVARDFERTVDKTADTLEALARAVRRTRGPHPDRAAHSGVGTSPGFSEAAQTIISEVMTAMPNLGLDQVLRAAQQADHLLLSETREA